MTKLIRAFVIATTWLLLNVSGAISQEMPVLFLDGKSHVELPRNLFDRTTEATIEAWVKWNRFNKWSRVFDFGREGNAVVLQIEKTSNTLNYRIWDRSGKRHGTQKKKAVNTGVWYHIATVSGPGGMEFYINGRLVDEDKYNGSLSEAAGGMNYIGKSNWPDDKLFEGYISDLRIWSKRRSQEDIRFSMDQALSGKEDGLLAYYRFTEADGDQVPNVVDPNKPARMVGTAKLENVPAIAPLLVPGEIDKLAETHYEKAKTALDAQEFNVAIKAFEALTAIYPGYKNANSLYAQARGLEARRKAENLYRAGTRSVQRGDYRQAYSNFKAALGQVTGFKDAQRQMQTALEKAKYRVAIYPFKSSILGANITLLQQILMTNLIEGRSIFVEYVDQQVLNRLFISQGINFSLIDPIQTLANAKKADIPVVVFGDLLTATATRSGPHREGKTAYTAWVSDGRIVGRGPQRTYYIVSQSVQVSCEATYKILDTQTGSVLRSGTARENLGDKVEYATYHGDVNTLMSEVYLKDGEWKAISLYERRFNARRDLRSTEELKNEALKRLGKKIASSVNFFTSSYSPTSQ